MAVDADIGQSVASQLTSLNISGVGTVSFTFDPYHESDNLPSNTKVWITVNEISRVLTTRGVWCKQCSILLYMIVAQSPTDAPGIEAWLDVFDAVLNSVEGISANGKLPYEILQEDRFDVDRLNNDKRLICKAIISYKLI